MCFSGVAAAITGFGIGESILGSYNATKAQNKANKANSRIAEMNAQQLSQQAAAERAAGNTAAAQELEKGQLDYYKWLRDVSQMQGTQRAEYAGSGVVVDRDTAGEVVKQTGESGYQDAMQIQANAKKAADAQIAAANERARQSEYQSKLLLEQSKSLKKQNSSPWASAGSSLLNGLSRFIK